MREVAPMRLQAIRIAAPAVVAALAGCLLLPLAALPARADSGHITPIVAQTFRGWGMSLAWEANDLCGGAHQPARITDPAIQSHYMDLLFGDPATGLTLGFTIARYNIGGGDDPSHHHMRPDAQMEGFEAAAGAMARTSRPISPWKRSSSVTCATKDPRRRS